MLVPLKKILALYFARVSVLFTDACDIWDDQSGSYKLSCQWVWVFVEAFLVERTVLGSSCFVGLCEGDPFLLQGIQV